jgi:hypothetical protein
MYEQKLYQLKTELTISHSMKKELTMDLMTLQNKYDKDHTAAELQIKAVHDKYLLNVKELSEAVGGKQ